MKEIERADAQHPNINYEKRDIHIFYVAATGALLLIAAVIIHAAVLRLYDHFDARESGKGQTRAAQITSRQVPPEPRLQTDPASDLRRMRAREDAALHAYGWADRQKGIVTIPIERAMQLLAARGLPKTSTQTAATTSQTQNAGSAENRTTQTSGDANSGLATKKVQR